MYIYTPVYKIIQAVVLQTPTSYYSFHKLEEGCTVATEVQKAVNISQKENFDDQLQNNYIVMQ